MIRTRENSRKSLACTENLPKHQLSKNSTPIYWKCLFTFGCGSLEDPLLSSFSLPAYSILDLSECQGKERNKSFNCHSLLAILDDHGLLHINDLSIVISFLNSYLHAFRVNKSANPVCCHPFQSSIPVIKVKNEISNEKSSLKHIENNTRNDFPTFKMSTSYNKHICTTNPGPLHKKDPTIGFLDRKRLRLLLREFGKFPNKYR
ncbi:unnamed protein product [Schistosoma mattheei]|uniref:Uncharacterized protein n=1 Tax=Schistosoma mattheei TaxID=31246 RepID=A0A3P8JYH0_9TREM|nr:unnamed protein product [Schistosoma mattheei]